MVIPWKYLAQVLTGCGIWKLNYLAQKVLSFLLVNESLELPRFHEQSPALFFFMKVCEIRIIQVKVLAN